MAKGVARGLHLVFLAILLLEIMFLLHRAMCLGLMFLIVGVALDEV